MVAAKLARLQVGNVASQKSGVSIDTPSLQNAADQLQVGRATVVRAKSVLEHGSPELIQAVERGEVAVSRAATVAKTTPKEKQVEVAKSTRFDAFLFFATIVSLY